MGLRPAEFWILTPAELGGLAKGFVRRQKDEWRRTAFLGAIILNSYSKKQFKPEDLISFPDEEDGEKEAELSEGERRERAMENLRAMKSKFWTKLEGDSLDKIKIYGEK